MNHPTPITKLQDRIKANEQLELNFDSCNNCKYRLALSHLWQIAIMIITEAEKDHRKEVL